MGLFDFVKDAGEKLFGGDEPEVESQADPQIRTKEMALADKAKGETLTRLATSMDMGIESLQVRYRDGVATLSGAAPSQETREKLILMVGNTQGVSRVDDQLTIEKPEPEAVLYTVQPGDSLSKIAKAHYGDAMKYMQIFEANKPMLKDPNKIYPGQSLRIPPKN